MRIPAIILAALLLLFPFLAARGSEPPLTLENAIRLALANNRSIKVDSYSRAIARANLLTACGAFEPTLTFKRSYAEDGTPASQNPLVTELIKEDSYSLALAGTTPWGLTYSLGGSATNTRYSYEGFANSFYSFGGIEITQPLLKGFGFGTNLLGVRVARASRSISAWQYRQTVIDTVAGVVEAYSNLALAHQYLKAVQRTRDGAAELLAQNEKRFKVGGLSDNDVTSARARTALREQSVLAAEHSVREADNQLRFCLGEAAFPADGPLLTIEDPVAPEIEVRPADDLRRAFALRSDYQQSRLGLDQSRYNAIAARNQLLPRVDFVGSYGYNGLDADFAASRRMVTGQDNRSYSAGVVVSIPLTFAEARGKARAAHLQFQQTEAKLRLLEENIAVAVANAADQVETSRKRVVATKTALTLNEQLLDAELKRLRTGTGSTFNVLYQQEYLNQADIQYSQALADERSAVVQYERAIGTLLDRYHVDLSEKS